MSPNNPSVRQLLTLIMNWVSSAFSKSFSCNFLEPIRPDTVTRWISTDISISSSLTGLYLCFPVWVRLTMQYRSIKLLIQRRSTFKCSDCCDLGSMAFILYESIVLVQSRSAAKERKVEMLNLTSSLRSLWSSSRKSACKASTHETRFRPRPIRALSRVPWSPKFFKRVWEDVSSAWLDASPISG